MRALVAFLVELHRLQQEPLLFPRFLLSPLFLIQPTLAVTDSYGLIRNSQRELIALFFYPIVEAGGVIGLSVDSVATAESLVRDSALLFLLLSASYNPLGAFERLASTAS